MNNEETLLDLYQQASESQQKIEEAEEKLRQEELSPIIKESQEIDELIDKINPRPDWREQRTKDINELKGIIHFLTPILKLKLTRNLEVEFHDKESHIENKKFFISKRGFYFVWGGNIRKSVVHFHNLIGYFSKSPELSQKLKSKMNSEEKAQFDIILDYLKVRDKGDRDYDFSQKIKRDFHFFDVVGYKKEKAQIIDFELVRRTLIINFKTNNRENNSKRFGLGIDESKSWNLTFLIPLKDEILTFLQERKNELIKQNKKQIEIRDKFYDLISPYLVLNSL